MHLFINQKVISLPDELKFLVLTSVLNLKTALKSQKPSSFGKLTVFLCNFYFVIYHFRNYYY